jgi:hypothetical protein
MENKQLAILAISLLVAALVLTSACLIYVANKPVAIQEKLVPVEKEVIVQVESNKTAELYDYFSEDIQDKKDTVVKNNTAKSLSFAEIAKRDFKKDIVKLMNDNAIENMSVEDYEDIEIYYSEITEVDLSGEDAEVLMTIKVKGFNADDQEDDFKARIYVIFEVEGLDMDELDDAEVADYKLKLSKVY